MTPVDTRNRTSILKFVTLSGESRELMVVLYSCAGGLKKQRSMVFPQINEALELWVQGIVTRNKILGTISKRRSISRRFMSYCFLRVEKKACSVLPNSKHWPLCHWKACAVKSLPRSLACRLAPLMPPSSLPPDNKFIPSVACPGTHSMASHVTQAL